MTQHESAHEETEDRFYAQFDSREVQLMTLDELQTAFEAGQIHENTFVCREGDSEWLTLADVAGLGEEDEPEEAPAPAPVVEARPPMPQRRPDMPGAVETRPPMPSRRPEAPAASETRPPMPPRRPEMNTVPAARFQQAAAASVMPVAPVATSSPLSFAPVTSNLDYSSLDIDEHALRPKRRWGVVLAAAAVLALAGGGTVFALNGGGSALASAIPGKASLDAASKSSQASLTLTDSEPHPSEPVAPAAAPAPSAPEPVAAAAPEAPAEAPKSTPQLSDDMKQALLAADKTHATKHAAKVKAHVAAPAPLHGKSRPPSGGGLKSSGSAYDPLNGNL